MKRLKLSATSSSVHPKKKQSISTSPQATNVSELANGTSSNAPPTIGDSQASINPHIEGSQEADKHEQTDEEFLANLKAHERSEIWPHYTRERQENGRVKGVCNYCGKKYYADTRGNGTTNLIIHLDKCLKYPPNVEKMKAKGQQFFVPRKEKRDVEMVSPCTSDRLTRLQVEHIIIDELPFSHVEGIGFIRMMREALPQWKLPCRKKIAKEVLKIYLEEKEKLKGDLKGRRVCLTTDIWTSLQNISYMVITCHFIDDAWVLHKRVLSFCPIEDHRGETIAKILEDCLLEWEIERVLTITVDNASANDLAIRELIKRLGNWKQPYVILEGGKNFHMRCVAHILNLIVGDGLKPMGAHIEAIRSAVWYVRSSPQRLDLFKKCVERVKINGKGLVVLDVVTRWNSTYLMLQSALKFVEAFHRSEVDDRNFSRSPTSDDWETARIYADFLKPFYEVTLRVCCSNTPTIHQGVGDLIRILGVLEDQPKIPQMVDIALPMEEKFKKYWGDLKALNEYMFVALILDPRYKCEKLVDYLEVVYGDEIDNEKIDSVMKGVKQCLANLYNVYVEESGVERTNISGESVDFNDPSLFVGLSNLEKKMKIKELKRTAMKKEVICNDMDRYITDPIEKNIENFNLMDWWRVNGVSKYPILARISRDILAIPISTISSESSFSTSGRVINPHRCSLSTKIVEALICTQSWLKGEGVAFEHAPTIEEMEICEEAERDIFTSGLSSESMLPPRVTRVQA